MTRDFDDLVDVDELDPDEAERLRRVHELLVQAGPPPDLPPALESPSEPADAEIVQFPLLPRRRWAVAAVLAAALALAAFGGGYYYASHKHGKSGFDAVKVVPMRGRSGALASIQMGKRDSVGNWQLRFSVSGLPEQRAPAYYNLWLVKHGKPVVLCGSFRVKAKTTTVTFSVPYDTSRFQGWVVTAERPPFKHHGPVVLAT
jgi:hypothetical protein